MSNNPAPPQFREWPIDNIILNPEFLLRHPSRESIDLVKKSIAAHGQLNPCILRPVGPKGPLNFVGGVDMELVGGHVRFVALHELKYKNLWVSIRPMSDEEAVLIAIADNLDRTDLTPLEEAEAFRKLVDMGLTQNEIADKVGRSQPYIANKIRLLKLEEPVKKMVDKGEISMGHAEHALLPLTGRSKLQKDVANRIVKDDMTVRDAERTSKRWLEEAKTKEKIGHAVKDPSTKYPICPYCKERNARIRAEKKARPTGYHDSESSGKPEMIGARGLPWVRCRNYHTWSLTEGKLPEDKPRAKDKKKAKPVPTKVIRVYNKIPTMAQALKEKVLAGSHLTELKGDVKVKVLEIKTIEDVKIDGMQIELPYKPAKDEWGYSRSRDYLHIWITEGPLKGLSLRMEPKEYQSGQSTKCDVFSSPGNMGITKAKEKAKEFINDLVKDQADHATEPVEEEAG